VILFALNAIRIAALIMIGDSGAREVAVGGFHSQAGWIAFNSVAFGLCIVAGRVPWISNRPVQLHAPGAAAENPTATYLIPFLAILAAGMLSQSLSGSFEWLYSLRLFAALLALWIFRKGYRDIDWRSGWLGIGIGVIVFAIWIAMDRLLSGVHQPMPAPLAGAPTTVQALWIALRVLGAAVTVPVAEELAFRGFLLRRLISPDFETVSYRQCTWLAVTISSVLFGILHGDRWLAGSLAGGFYALATIRSGRLGDAVVAHATTNALLACYVLETGNWILW
jgi:exosortase E/protease (VPEID-CTERM system)